MLEFLRKTKRGIFGLLTICFLGAMLIPFGVGVYTKSDTSPGITVDNEEISPNEFYAQLENWDRYYRAQLKDGYEQLRPFLNLRQRTSEELVNRKLIENFADSLNLSAGATQIQDKIRSHPYFQGNLTRESLQEFLDAQGLTSGQLEAITKKQIINEQLVSTLALGTIPSEAELKKLHKIKNQQFSFRYISFDASNYISKVDTSNENNLKTFFTDHSEEYRKPASVKFQFVKFAPVDYRSHVEISGSDLLAVYEKEKHTFTEPKQVHLRQIVINKEDSAEKSKLEKLVTSEKHAEQKKKLAEQTLSRVNSGEEFAAVAKTASEDQKTAASGGDIGWIKYSDLPLPLRNAASELEVKTPSAVIEHEGAYYILYAEEKRDARVKEFTEVRQSIEDRMRDEDAPVYARVRAQDFLDKWLANTNASLQDEATKENLTAAATKDFISTESSGDIAPELIKQVVELGAGSKNIIDIGSDAYVIEVVDAKPSYIPELAEVKEEVTKNYSQEKARELAKSDASKALEKLRAVTSQDTVLTALQEIAQQFQLEVLHLGPVSQSANQSGILASPNASKIAFSLSESNRVSSQLIESQGSLAIITLEKQTTSEDTGFEKDKEKLRTAELQQGATRLLSSLITALKTRSTVTIEPSLLEENS